MGECRRRRLGAVGDCGLVSHRAAAVDGGVCRLGRARGCLQRGDGAAGGGELSAVHGAGAAEWRPFGEGSGREAFDTRSGRPCGRLAGAAAAGFAGARCGAGVARLGFALGVALSRGAARAAGGILPASAAGSDRRATGRAARRSARDFSKPDDHHHAHLHPGERFAARHPWQAAGD